MKIFALVSLLMLVSVPSLADRSVSIAVADGRLELTNGSTVPVNYTVECYDRVTGTNIITDGSAQTMNAKASRVFQSAGMCANGNNPNYKSPNGPYACAGSVTYANAATLCGPQSTLCTLASLRSKSVTSFQGFPSYYWVSPGSTTWYQAWDAAWSKSSPYTVSGGGKNYAIRTYTDKANDSRCNETDTGTGALSLCSSYDVNSNSPGSVCCPDNNGFKSCKVTIHSSTAASGHLQSPQFKGGSSF